MKQPGRRHVMLYLRALCRLHQGVQISDIIPQLHLQLTLTIESFDQEAILIFLDAR